ncbi:urea carboxylase-associated family protein [Marinomonas sp. C2222]|uniref:Urea carboxylase-associated family protein n=1 Tax=Marinomonas sargassi TaxID=2984494 RepID=A0ABT2YU56_9GAMM|nr:urea amidolyase associated protein UAAP1 [Marinomonas sargassi]MCV2403422.1 urea carboxylase-associated family protein [Marinomonas sargassi]
MKQYKTTIPAASHWSLKVRRGMQMTLTDLEGGANVGMVFYNPENLLERYNAPDTLKGQHTFKLTKGHCLYSDMGRIFASITEDTVGWHETVAGNSHASHVAAQWGKRDYQNDQNEWLQNGTDAFLVEMAKYGLTQADSTANLNLFSKVVTDADGNMLLEEGNSPAGSSVTLRFEMDTLVMLHTCAHPLSKAATYPKKPISLLLEKAAPVAEDDFCKMSRPENQRGFANNELYHLGCED